MGLNADESGQCRKHAMRKKHTRKEARRKEGLKLRIVPSLCSIFKNIRDSALVLKYPFITFLQLIVHKQVSKLHMGLLL
jgi:hypothetical protein